MKPGPNPNCSNAFFLPVLKSDIHIKLLLLLLIFEQKWACDSFLISIFYYLSIASVLAELELW